MKNIARKYKIQKYSIQLPVIVILLVLIFACRKKPETQPVEKVVITEKTTIVLNEGNFGSNNASISLIDLEKQTITNNYYTQINGKPLGDVVQSISIFDNKAYIVVNNSNKIEVVTLNGMKNIHTITGINTPRFMEVINSEKAYVTSLYGNCIYVINPSTYTTTATIPVNGWTENMIFFNNQLLVANMNKGYIYFMDISNNSITDSIATTIEPNSMVLDYEQNLWVLCGGGWNHVQTPALLKINPSTKTIMQKLQFQNANSYPSQLVINSDKKQLYFIDKDIFTLSVNDTILPQTPVITANGKLFYSLSISPVSNHLFVSDAVNYLSNGNIFQFDLQNHQIIKQYQAAIIPSKCYFVTSTEKQN